ncbi:MAG: phospholipase D-like domain-containing protein, partial [Candidatus Poribacteria bacterium]|nr:phospholipase D-like domain-containing protein [Candidatus Poribacteria bacterium]
GQQTYSGLIDVIDSATRSLHITVFIFGKDEMARDIVARLAKRAAEGIDVRVLIDSVGSFWTRKEVVEPLLRASGRVVRFLPVLSAPLRGRANLRNHRKIILADDARVIAGGINIASNYFGPTDDPQRWQDLAFYIEGPATHSFAEIFRSDWAFATGERIAISEDAHPPQATGNAVIQVVPAGPDVRDDPLYVAILSAIFTATSRVWIVSPYFIPNDTLAQALALAARRGVDVRILVPKRSNHRLTDFARDTYLRQVQESGGIIQHYVPGMMHAKAVLVDDSFAVIGSANFDMRSLFLSFEVAAFVYSRSEIDSLEDWMETLMRRSEIGIEEAGFAREMVESAVRLFATQL